MAKENKYGIYQIVGSLVASVVAVFAIKKFFSKKQSKKVAPKKTKSKRK